MKVSPRAFVLRHSRLQEVPDLSGLRLHLADDVLATWRATQDATGDRDAPIPYWAVAWGGGLAIAGYLREHPEAVSGRRVLDVGSGSGLCAIAAMRAGALAATAVDVDPFAAAAIRLNARANRVRVEVSEDDILDSEPPPEIDMILVGDCWYEEGLATRLTRWVPRASASGIDVLLGDPGRRYFDRDAVTELASYEVRSTSEIEDLGRTRAGVYGFDRAHLSRKSTHTAAGGC
jgi:predicted nicotinamide N-methyase